MKQPKPSCPNCKGTDLDCWPEGHKYGYCYTCKESVTVVYPSDHKDTTETKE